MRSLARALKLMDGGFWVLFGMFVFLGVSRGAMAAISVPKDFEQPIQPPSFGDCRVLTNEDAPIQRETKQSFDKADKFYKSEIVCSVGGQIFRRDSIIRVLSHQRTMYKVIRRTEEYNRVQNNDSKQFTQYLQRTETIQYDGYKSEGYTDYGKEVRYDVGAFKDIVFLAEDRKFQSGELGGRRDRQVTRKSSGTGEDREIIDNFVFLTGDASNREPENLFWSVEQVLEPMPEVETWTSRYTEDRVPSLFIVFARKSKISEQNTTKERFLGSIAPNLNPFEKYDSVKMLSVFRETKKTEKPQGVRSAQNVAVGKFNIYDEFDRELGKTSINYFQRSGKNTIKQGSFEAGDCRHPLHQQLGQLVDGYNNYMEEGLKNVSQARRYERIAKDLKLAGFSEAPLPPLAVDRCTSK